MQPLSVFSLAPSPFLCFRKLCLQKLAEIEIIIQLAANCRDRFDSVDSSSGKYDSAACCSRSSNFLPFY